MIVWYAAFNIAYQNGTKKSVEAVQDSAGARITIGTEDDLNMARRLPKFAELMQTMGIGNVAYLPPDVVSYNFRCSSITTNGHINVCGSNEQLGGIDIVVSDTAVYDELKADDSFSTYFAPASVVLINTAYVDYDPGDSSAEASNVIAGLESFGRTVKTFTDVSAAGLNEALQGVGHLIIPELENFGGNGADIFSAEAKEAIRQYVAAGNTFVAFFTTEVMTEMVNALFDWSISEGSEGTGTYNRTAQAADYGFSSGPSTLLVNNATFGTDEATLPAGAVPIYKEDSGSCAVTLIPYGDGRVILFGWDWYNAQPVGAYDRGWLAVLDIATS